MPTAKERYEAAAHAMQTGVKAMMKFEEPDTGSTSPKHLRVGVNMALIDSGALAGLLIRKGLIGQEEYEEALADMAEKEKARYEVLLGSHYGGKSITLA